MYYHQFRNVLLKFALWLLSTINWPHFRICLLLFIKPSIVSSDIENESSVCVFFLYTALKRSFDIDDVNEIPTSTSSVTSPISPSDILNKTNDVRSPGNQVSPPYRSGLVSAAALPRAPFWEIGWFPVSPSTEAQWESPLSMLILGSTELPLFKTNSTPMASLRLLGLEVTMTVSIAPLPVWSTRPLQNSAPTQALPRVMSVLGNSKPNV